MSVEEKSVTTETEAKPINPFVEKFNKALEKTGEKPIEEKKEEKAEEKPVEEEKPNKAFDSFSKSMEKREDKKEEKKEDEATKEAEVEAGTDEVKKRDFASLRKAKEAAEKRAEEAEKKAKEIEGRIPTDYETLKQEAAKAKEDRELLASELKKYSLEATPDFKEKYDKPLKTSAAQIERAVASAGGDATQVIDLLKQPESRARNEALSELVDGMDGLTKAKVSTAIAEYDRIRENREAELKAPDNSLKLLQEQQATRAKQQQELSVKLIDSTVERNRKELPWMTKGEDPEYNQQLDHIEANAKKFWLEPLKPEEQAEVAYRAAQAPFLGSMLNAAHLEIKRLSEIVAKQRSGNPETKVGNKVPEKTPSKTPFTDKVLKQVGAN